MLQSRSVSLIWYVLTNEDIITNLLIHLSGCLPRTRITEFINTFLKDERPALKVFYLCTLGDLCHIHKIIQDIRGNSKFDSVLLDFRTELTDVRTYLHSKLTNAG